MNNGLKNNQSDISESSAPAGAFISAMVLTQWRKPKDNTMKRNETKTRTVWYFRMDDKDIKAFNNLQDACGFARDYLSKKFGKMYSASRFEDGSVVFSSRVVETKVIGSSSYPEMVNARYEDSLKATEPVVEESKPSGQIVWRYEVQFQDSRMKAGWIGVGGDNFDTKQEAIDFVKELKDVSDAFERNVPHTDPYSEPNVLFCRTRIKKVGELI